MIYSLNNIINPALKLLGVGFLLLAFSLKSQNNASLWQEIEAVRKQSSTLFYSNPDSANLLLEQAFDLVEKPIDTLIYSKLLSNKGYSLQTIGEYDQAAKFYLDALELCRIMGDSLQTSHAYSSLANLSYYTNDYDNCRIYSRKSLQLLTNGVGKPGHIAHRYNVLALTYFDEDQIDSALHYFTLGLSYLKKDTNARQSTYVIYYDNIGQCLEESGKTQEADAYYRKSLAITLEKEWNDDILWTFNRMINNFLRQDKLDSAKKYIQWSKSYLPAAVEKDVIKDLLSTEAFYYARQYDADSLNKKLYDYGRISEELIEARTAANIQEMTAKYDLERKEASLALAKEETARFEQENKTQRILLFIAVIGLIFLVGALFFLRNFYRQRRKLSLMELEIKDNKLDELMSAQESKTYAAMLKGQQQERERIARDLHDRLGGTLAALKHSLRSPENKIKAEDLEIVDQAVKEVRDVSHNLASTQFADFGLKEALSQLKSTIEKVGEVRFEVYLHPSTSKLEQKVTIELYRIVQELLSNTLKHAQANQISVQTNLVENVFNLIYEDNGKGFDLSKVKRGMGIDNMRARVKKMKGQLNIDTEKGRGTIVIVEINLEL